MEVLMKKKIGENEKTFSDFSNKSWFTEADGRSIKAADNISKILAGDCETIEVKELLHGEPARTWKIIIAADDKTYLLKTSRELR
jgi:hypothetical protein